MTESKKPFFWSFLLVALGTLYLLPEAIFNSQLVSLVGLGTPSKEDLEHLELYGRTVSGVGVTLLFLDLLPNRFVKRPAVGTLSFFLLLGILWPTVFYGQKFLIEKTIIEPSSAEERQHAVFSAAIRDALSANVINVDGVDYQSDLKQSPENLTFISLFGGLLYADSTLSGNLEDSKRKIIHKFVQKRAYDDFDDHYQEYSRIYDDLTVKYKEYAKASGQYNDAIDGIPQREADYWSQVETEINTGFAKYQDAQKAHKAKASARAQKYGPKIVEYFKEINDCRESYKKDQERRQKCYIRYQASYKTMIMEAGIGYIEPNYWLIVEEVSTTENVANTVLSGVLTGGLSLVLQLADAATGGNGGIQDFRSKYTNDPDHYQTRFLSHPKFIKMFEDDFVYPFNIQNIDSFREHKETQLRLRKTFKKKGLSLSDNWTIHDRNEFTMAVDKKVREEASSQWQQGVKKRGLTMGPNINWDDFQLHSDVQARLKVEMGEKYVPNTRADWNKSSFKQFIVDPNVDKKTEEYLTALNSTVENFQNDGKYAEYGKQALRSVVIPPISMFLSLFLICLTIAKLPAKYWALLTYKKEKKPLPKILTIINKVYMPILILTLPVIFVANTFTDNKESTVNYFLDKVEESSNPAFSYVLKWTLHTQPLIHPVGNELEGAFGVYKGFKPFAKSLHAIDVMTDVSPNTVSRIERFDLAMKAKGMIMLNVLVDSPDTTTIQVMNIGPKYQSEMQLTPGSYDIKVTFGNGEVYRQMFDLDAGYHSIDLRKETERKKTSRRRGVETITVVGNKFD